MDVLEKFIDLPSGFKVFSRYKEANHPEWLIVTHGIGEHSGRYDFIFNELSHKYNIFCYDLRSHGKSAGKKGNIKDFGVFKKDLNQILLYLKEHFSMKTFSLFGHSMGALIVADYIQSHQTLAGNVLTKDFYPQKVFLSSPPVAPGGLLGKIVQKTPDFLIKNLAELPYGIGLTDLLNKQDLSHDISVGETYLADPLVLKKLNSRFLFQLVYTGRKVFSEPLNPKCPLYCIVGTEDKIVEPGPLMDYAQLIEPKMELKIIEGGRHELHNEIDRYFIPYQEFLHKCL